jgi:hypothetical protein
MSLFARLSELPEGHAECRTDFDKRYTNTYMIDYSEEKPKVLLNRGLDGGTIHFRMKNTTSYLIDGRKDHPIEPFMPKPGYYNSKMNILYIYKTPNRQWKRSFSSGIYRVNNELATDKNNWFDIIEGILDNKYVHLDMISNELFSKFAITPQFAVKPDCHLYYKEFIIGKMNFQKYQINLLEPELKQEIVDFFKHHGVYKWKLNLTPQE